MRYNFIKEKAGRTRTGLHNIKKSLASDQEGACELSGGTRRARMSIWLEGGWRLFLGHDLVVNDLHVPANILDGDLLSTRDEREGVRG
jgi:hypothetical protein